jgi:TonB family protein
MTGLLANERMFKRAVVFSAAFHALLFTVIAISPSMTKPVQKSMIHYVSLGGLSGGGGGGGTGGGGGPKAAVQPPAKKQTLRDLAVPSKLKPEVKPSMTYPVDKPKKDKKGKDEKMAAITRPQPNLPGAQAEKMAAPDSTAGAGQGAGQGAGPGGSGLRIGLGEGPGGGGFGSEYGDQIGLSGFPYQYYLQIISDRVSSSWFTSLVDPGISGTFFATVYFKILRNGQVTDLKVKESSGIQSLDMSAQRAIQISAPFPPLPSDYEGDYLGIHLIFEHSK